MNQKRDSINKEEEERNYLVNDGGLIVLPVAGRVVALRLLLDHGNTSGVVGGLSIKINKS